jgi:hypothetical protein
MFLEKSQGCNKELALWPSSWNTPLFARAFTGAGFFFQPPRVAPLVPRPLIPQQRTPAIAFHGKAGRGSHDPDLALVLDLDKHVALLVQFNGQMQMAMQQSVHVAIANDPNIRIH